MDLVLFQLTLKLEILSVWQPLMCHRSAPSENLYQWTVSWRVKNHFEISSNHQRDVFAVDLKDAGLCVSVWWWSNISAHRITAGLCLSPYQCPELSQWEAQWDNMHPVQSSLEFFTLCICEKSKYSDVKFDRNRTLRPVVTCFETDTVTVCITFALHFTLPAICILNGHFWHLTFGFLITLL